MSDVVKLLVISTVKFNHLLFKFLVTLLLQGTGVDVSFAKLVIFDLLLLDRILDFVDLVLLLLDFIVHCVLGFLALLFSSGHLVLKSLVLVFHLLLERSLHLTHLVVKFGK